MSTAKWRERRWRLFSTFPESFQEQVIREHQAQYGVSGSALETRYGAEGQGPSIYIQDPEGNTVELKGSPVQ